jgi:hypothetical protein
MVKEAVMCEESIAPPHHSLKVSRRPTGTKRYKRKLTYSYAHLGRGQDFRVFNNDVNALERAAKERLFYVKDKEGGFVEPPDPAPEVFSSEIQKYESFLTRHGRLTPPLTKEQFLRAYDGRKRTIYENAFESLLMRPLAKQDAEVKFFIKQEKTNFTRKPNSVPRGISPRDPRYHVSLGPFIKRIEKLVYKRIDEMWGGPTIMKGKNAKQRGEAVFRHWNSFKNPVALGIDASRFDQHVHIEALKFEHRVYLSFFKGVDRRNLAKLLKMQEMNRGRGRTQDGHLSFSLEGKRMSGDMNTALGNCLQMSTMVKAIVDKYGIQAKFINDGDDGVIFIEKEDHLRLQSVIYDECLRFGHEVVLEPPANEIEGIEFCQCKFVATSPGEYLAVRHIENSFDKDAMCLDPLITPKLAAQWMRSVGECGLSLTSGLPVLQQYYLHFMAQASVGKRLSHQIEGFRMLAEGMGSPKYRQPTPWSRYSFWKAFGIPPDAQEEWEKHFMQLKTSHKVSTNYLNQPPALIKL